MRAVMRMRSAIHRQNNQERMKNGLTPELMQACSCNSTDRASMFSFCAAPTHACTVSGGGASPGTSKERNDRSPSLSQGLIDTTDAIIAAAAEGVVSAKWDQWCLLIVCQCYGWVKRSGGDNTHHWLQSQKCSSALLHSSPSLIQSFHCRCWISTLCVNGPTGMGLAGSIKRSSL